MSRELEWEDCGNRFKLVSYSPNDCVVFEWRTCPWNSEKKAWLNLKDNRHEFVTDMLGRIVDLLKLGEEKE